MLAGFRHGGRTCAPVVFALGSLLRARRWCVAALTAAITACGGGGGGSPPPPPQPQLSLSSQPADRSVVDGDRADFTVQASAAASYQWQREDAGAGWVAIPGATSATYELAAVHAADDGSQYRVIVTSTANAALSLTSSSAALHVAARQVAPAILVAPADARVVEGQVASFSITAAGTSLVYQWQRGTAGTAFADIEGATTAMLTLPPVAMADDGARFRVVVSNALATMTSDAVGLAVTPAPAAPVFKAGPADVAVVEGTPATFNVVVVGSPAPSLRWQSSRDGVAWTDVAGQSAASLTLASPALGDEGTLFRAVATNASGSVPTPSARLNVAPHPAPPTIGQQPTDVVVGVGATPAFSVAASGVPAPAYQWQASRDGGASFANVNGATLASYTVPATVEGDDGLRLRVVVSNASGSVTSAAVTLAVIPVPHLTLQPEGQAWHVGEGTPMFQVVAAGSGLTYQWQTRAGAGASFVDVPGETAPTYFHAGGSTDPTTDVRVRVTNSRGGVAVSNVAPLVALTWRTLHPVPTTDILNDVRWVDATTVVAVGDGGTIIRSTDAGQTWSAVVEKEPAHAFRLAAVDFNGAQVGVAVGQGGLIRRTVDGGVHWVTVRPSAPTSGGYDGRYAGLGGVAFTDDHTVVASDGSHVVLHSDDAGQTWTAVDVGVGVSRMASRHGLLVALSDAGVVRSINGGMQWEAVAGTGTGGSGTGAISTLSPTGIAFASDSVVVICGWMGFARSTDAGLTWQLQTANFAWTLLETVGFADALHGVAIGQDSQGPEAYVTSDGGASWTPDAAWDESWTDFHAVSFGSSGSAIVVGPAGKIRRSADQGVSWTDGPGALVHGVNSISSLAFPTPNLGMMVGFGTMLRSTDGGSTWQPVNTPLSGSRTQWRKIVFTDATHATALQSWSSLAQSVDGGVTWIDRSGALGLAANTQLNDLQFAPNGVTGFVTTTIGTLMRTNDGGVTWNVARQAPNSCLDEVAFGTNVDVVMADCDGGLEVSHDAGATWTRIDPMGVNHYSLHPQFLDATTVLATSTGLMFRSADAGRTWTTIEDSFQVNPPNRGNPTFVSQTEGFMVYSDGSVSHTVDGGRSWSILPSARAAGMYYLVARTPHELWGLGSNGLAVTGY